MADIVLKCRQCAKETAVSEYVEADAIPCRSCGKLLKLPARASAPQAPRAKEPEKAAAPASVLPAERSTMTAFRAVEERSKKRKKRRAVWTWTPNSALLLAIFIAGTLILSLFRYTGILADSDKDIYIKFGMFALLVGHLTICVDAFNDNIMQGVLCLFVPFYSIYYLFAETDSFLLRVIIGIFLLPFSPDYVVMAYNIGKNILAFVSKLGGADY